MTKDFTVAIVAVNVFEAGSKFEEGLTCYEPSKGWDYTRPSNLARSITFREFLFLSGLDEHKVVYDYPMASADDLGLGIYGPVFLDAVVGLLNTSTVHFNKRCVSITSTETTTAINFTDGTKQEADLKHMAFINTITYRGLIPLEDVKAAGLQTQLSTRPIMLVGLNKYFVIYPIHMVLVSKRDIPLRTPLPSPWAATASGRELQDHFQEWGRDTRIIVDHMKTYSKWSIHTLYPPFGSYYRGRVVLVGDTLITTRHTVCLPVLGQALARGLKTLKNDVTKSNIEDALQAYTEVIPPRVN
ncbi:hypothetical protein DFS33DRAFT_1413515 [Desarmillaria ectypa]|nr:hypothetical protein DFS33DRAFT_1413515 [Desarmillaria ectypa]